MHQDLLRTTSLRRKGFGFTQKSLDSIPVLAAYSVTGQAGGRSLYLVIGLLAGTATPLLAGVGCAVIYVGSN